MNYLTLWHGGLLAASLFAAAVPAADLTVRVDAREVPRNRVHTDITLAVKPGPLTLVYPKWLPGEHTPTGPLESVIGLEIKANGVRLAWSRDPYDMYALRLTVPHSVDHLELSIESGLATEGTGFSAAPTGSEQLAILPWNEFLLFAKGEDADRISAVASVILPAGWSLASALASRPVAGGGFEFEAASVARLIDSPVQIGRYAKRVDLPGAQPRPDLGHSISLMADSAAALVTPDDFVERYGRLVAESGALFGSRMYRHYTWLLSLSDHVAHFGLEHHESSDDRIDENSLTEPELRVGVASLLGHEYVHSWNGKYRRPQGLLSPDYQRPMDGSLLWVYEGLTQFWGYVLPTRAGLISPDYYRDRLAASAGSFDIEPGARWRPLADTAVGAQLLYNAPQAWSSSRSDADFYDASMFLWLDVDAELQARSRGSATLDDFAKRFYAGASGAPQLKPYAEHDVYDTLAALAPGDWRAFIRRHLDVTGTAALLAALERSGWNLGYSGEKNAAVERWQKSAKSTDRSWSIGVSLDKDSKIIDVVEGRAAARAGAGPGMKLVAVNGRKFSAEVLDAAIAEAQTTHQPIALLVDNADFYRTLAVEYYEGARYPHLVRIDGRPDGLAALLASRLR